MDIDLDADTDIEGKPLVYDWVWNIFDHMNMFFFLLGRTTAKDSW